MAACKSCGARITFAITNAGNKTPLDAEPSDNGKFFISPGGLAIPVDDSGAFAFACREHNAPKHTSHFATCPNAASHRKPRS
jgi:hypothetical protein